MKEIYILYGIGAMLGFCAAVILIYLIVHPIYIHFYISIYYNSDAFYNLKEKTLDYIKECNELNEYIRGIKYKGIFNSYAECSSKVTGINTNTGKWNYQHPKLKGYQENNNKPLFGDIYYCSLPIIKGAREQPFKYICKYFDIPYTEDTLQEYEDLLNDYETIVDGIKILQEKKNLLIKQHKTEIPKLVLQYDKNFSEKLGFQYIGFPEDYAKTYIFRYISPGGNSGQDFKIIMDTETLSQFVYYLADKTKFLQSVQGQRKLMTPKLREQIKIRDNFTCCKCGVSIKDEPHLLLEVDHIIPLKKGGITEEGNLQTLCWKCNREKGTKIYT